MGRLYGLTWPGDSSIAINNYYLSGSYFVAGFKVNGTPYTARSIYPLGDWTPFQHDPFYQGPGRSLWDIETGYHDFLSSGNEP